MLTWTMQGSYREAVLGTEGDGVRFTITYHPLCFPRGQWELVVRVMFGPNSEKWGNVDSPIRYYRLENAVSEAEEIAMVLKLDRERA